MKIFEYRKSSSHKEAFSNLAILELARLVWVQTSLSAAGDRFLVDLWVMVGHCHGRKNEWEKRPRKFKFYPRTRSFSPSSFLLPVGHLLLIQFDFLQFSSLSVQFCGSLVWAELNFIYCRPIISKLVLGFAIVVHECLSFPFELLETSLNASLAYCIIYVRENFWIKQLCMPSGQVLRTFAPPSRSIPDQRWSHHSISSWMVSFMFNLLF